MFLYRDILKRSLAITFTHKNLWFFGIFASLLGGVSQYAMAMSRSPEDWTTNIFSNLVRLFKFDPTAAIIFSTFILIVLVVSLFIFWLAIVSQGGLINNAAAIIKNSGKKESVPARDGLEKGIKKFWPVLCFNLIGASLTCFFAALVGTPLVFMTVGADASVFLLYILLFILFIPLALMISFFIKYSICFSVIKDRKLVDAFIDGCRLFGKYWLVSLEMALILFIIEFIFIVILGLIVLTLAIPYVFVAQIVSLAFFVVVGGYNLSQLLLTAGLFFALLAVVLGGAIITTFKTVAWTDIFISLVDKKGGLAKLERLAAGLKK